jgi:hypothetical protein
MEAEHPIPQEVSTYQFKLVGDMTIQQFMQVAAGAIVSLIIYSTNMAAYVKWPLIIISFLIGIAFAFFPIEDRPLSKWLVLFVKAIYSPTVYVWNKNAVRHNFFAPENDIKFAQKPPSTSTGVLPTQAVQTGTQPAKAIAEVEAPDKLEAKEKEFLNKVDVAFTAPKDQPIIKSVPTIVLSTNTPQAGGNNVPVPTTQTPKISVQNNYTEAPKPSGDIFSSQSSVGNQVVRIASQNLATAQAVTYSPEAAPPSPPTRPNVIVGQTLDLNGKIVDGAILEIKDSEGRSARALRTNRLGHFMIVTPLSDGVYQITTEKDGFKFNPVSIKLENRVVPPIVIKGNKINQ